MNEVNETTNSCTKNSCSILVRFERLLWKRLMNERTNENIFCQTCAYLSAIACAFLFAHERKFSQHGLSTFLLYFFPCPALYFSLFIIIMNVLYPCISFSYFLFCLCLSFYHSFTHQKSFHLPIYFNPRKNL
jgi:hypothetical protein